MNGLEIQKRYNDRPNSITVLKFYKENNEFTVITLSRREITIDI